MDSFQDEHIVCADCGGDFVFTGAEAAFYRERDLAMPPKRCKGCRAARKSARAQDGGQAGARRFGGDGGERRSPPPRDDSWSGRPASGGQSRPSGPARHPVSARRDAGSSRDDGVSSAPRAHGATFEIVCSTCGATTSVPFRPLEGREVFCQPCYRARKPARS